MPQLIGKKKLFIYNRIIRKTKNPLSQNETGKSARKNLKTKRVGFIPRTQK